MKNRTILLVEDNYLDVESVKRAFRKLDINLTLKVAYNGVDAVALLTSGENKIIPDVILLDLNLPKMNGLEFLKVIKNYPDLKKIKIFIISTSKEEYEEIAAQNLGVSGYILKPLNFMDHTSVDTQKLMEELLKEDSIAI